jgi:hypothetical protein
VKLTPLQGDASTRRYFRFAGRYGSRILCRYPNLSQLRRFVDANGLYRRLGLPVPRLIAVDEKKLEIIQGDLGDETLEAAARREPGRLLAWCGEAVDFLGLLAPAAAQAGYPLPQSLYGRAHFEMNFFLRQFVARHGVDKNRPRISPLRRELRRLLQDWQQIPPVLCHRDYHRRNLMVFRGALVIIDHQDTRVGPAGYDLASLLYDSYGDFTPAQRRALARRAGASLDAPDFRRVALQRALKALGTFGYQLYEKKNRRYAPAVPRTLAHARDHLRALHGAGVEFPALAGYLQSL